MDQMACHGPAQGRRKRPRLPAEYLPGRASPGRPTRCGRNHESVKWNNQTSETTIGTTQYHHIRTFLELGFSSTVSVDALAGLADIRWLISPEVSRDFCDPVAPETNTRTANVGSDSTRTCCCRGPHSRPAARAVPGELATALPSSIEPIQR